MPNDTKWQATAKRFSTWLVVVVVALCGAVLVGWQLRIVDLMTLLPHGKPIRPWGVICVLILSLTLLNARPGKDRSPRRTLVMTAGAFVLFIATLNLIELSTDLDFGLADLLFPSALQKLDMLRAGRLTLNASMSYILSAAALILFNYDGKYSRFAAQGVVLTSLGLTLVVLSGYLFGVTRFLILPNLEPMPAGAALLTAMFNLGLLAGYPEQGPVELLLRDGPGSDMLKRFLPLMVVVPICVGMVSLLIFSDFGGQRVIMSSAVITIAFIFSSMLFYNAWSINRAHAVLSASESKFRMLTTLVPVGVYQTDPERRCTFANQKWLEMAGMTLHQALGDGWGQAIYHADKELFSSFWNKMVASKGDWGLSHRVKSTFGKISWVHGTAAELHDDNGRLVGCIGANTDISEIRQAQDAQRESEERYRLVADYAYGWEYWLLPDGQLEYVSPACFRITGYTAEEFRLDPDMMQRIVHPEDHEHACAQLRETCNERSKDSCEFRILTKDRETRWISHVCQPIYSDDGQWRGRRASNRDITERKRDEELRGHIERIVRHNLRTPAKNAVHLARMLREETSLPEEQRHNLLDLFEQSGQNMLDTLGSSLDLYKIETRQYQFKPEAFDCLDLVLGLIRTLTKDTRFGSIPAEVLLNGQPPQQDALCPCLGAPQLSQIALQNLLQNALEASPRGAPVVVELSSGKDCCIAIRNKGAVPTQIRDRFFEKYVTMGKSKGTGIGTYSAMMMVKAQGGDISMHSSDENNETVVMVQLPC